MSGRYRIDFAIADRKVGVEIDGHAYHSDKETFVRDRARQRALEIDGWRLIRFAAAEINEDVEDCVKQLVEWLVGIGLTYRNGKLPEDHETSVLDRLAAAFPPVDPVTGRTKLGGRSRRDPSRPVGPFPWSPANGAP